MEGKVVRRVTWDIEELKKMPPFIPEEFILNFLGKSSSEHMSLREDYEKVRIEEIKDIKYLMLLRQRIKELEEDINGN